MDHKKFNTSKIPSMFRRKKNLLKYKMIKITKINSKETKILTVTKMHKFSASIIILIIWFRQNQFNTNKIEQLYNQYIRRMIQRILIITSF